MNTFKPTHRISSEDILELEHEFEDRIGGKRYGLFYAPSGSALIHRMDAVTELPKTIQVAAHEEPEPLRAAPEVGTEYWVISDLYEEGVCDLRWTDDAADRRTLAAGEARATKEDALAARAARQKARGFA